MADIDLKRVHNLGMAAARAKADAMAEHLGKKFGLRGRWEGDVLRFERPGVTGSLAISAKDLHLVVSLGFLLKAMRGSIENAVQHELDSLFAPARQASPEPPKPKKDPPPRKKGG